MTGPKYAIYEGKDIETYTIFANHVPPNRLVEALDLLRDFLNHPYECAITHYSNLPPYFTISVKISGFEVYEKAMNLLKKEGFYK